MGKVTFPTRKTQVTLIFCVRGVPAPSRTQPGRIPHRNLLVGWGREKGNTETQPAPALKQGQPKGVFQFMFMAQVPSTKGYRLAFASNAILQLPLSNALRKGRNREKHYHLHSCGLFEIKSAISSISTSEVLDPALKLLGWLHYEK